MKLISLAAILAVAIAAPAFAADDAAKVKPGKAQPAAKADQTRAKAEADPSEKLICTREAQTDSSIPTRCCRTQAADRRGSPRRPSNSMTTRGLSDDQQRLSGQRRTIVDEDC